MSPRPLIRFLLSPLPRKKRVTHARLFDVCHGADRDSSSIPPDIAKLCVRRSVVLDVAFDNNFILSLAPPRLCARPPSDA
jgi:hypothetical protein